MSLDHRSLEKALEAVAGRWPKARPRCGLILGSGWTEVAEAFDIEDTLDYDGIPGLGKTGVAGHAGRLVLGRASGLEVLVFQGRRHWYEGEGWTPIALPVFLLKRMGATVLLLTNAAGGIRKGFKPGDLMIIEDQINLMDNPLIGAHHPFWGPRFPDQSAVYDVRLRGLLERAGRAAAVPLRRGVYLGSTGPAYETPAEVRMFRILGADAVGMSTVHEAMLAHAAGLRVAGISCITNLAAGISPTPLTHEEVTATTRAAMPRMKKVVGQFWKELAREKK